MAFSRSIVVLLATLFHLSSGQGFSENSMLWTNGSDAFYYMPNITDWLAGTGPPTTFFPFLDKRIQLEGIAVHHSWHEIVFSETGTKTIFVYQPTPSISAVYAHVGTSPLVGQVTVDWLSNNVYWADTGYGWIGLQGLKENLGTFSTGDRIKVVVSSSLDSPYGVAVLPHIRRIFWTDFGHPPKIESADLLGDNRSSLVWQGLSKPTFLTADATHNRLYWIDEAKETIESCDFSGASRKLLIYSRGSTLSGLTLFQDSILFAKRNEGTINAHNKVTGAEAATIFDVGFHPEAITVFSSLTQPRNDATCTSTSCNHICIHNTPHFCVCSSGYTLLPNGTCQASVTALWKSFLISTSTRICALPVTLLYSHSYLHSDYIRRLVQCFVNSADIRHIAVDSRNASVYYVRESRVHVRHIHTGNEDVLHYGSSEISGLAYDWLSSTIIWSERGSSNKIMGLVKGSSQPRTIYTSLVSPGDLAVDPRRGELFWFEMANGKYQLYRGTVAGGMTKTSILSSDLQQPHHLVYDHVTSRLYWLDVSSIGSVTRNGTGRNALSVSSVTQRNGLAVFRGYLIWASSTPTNLTFRDVDLTQTADSLSFTLPDPMDITGLAVYDANENSADACELDNGGCSQLCVVHENGRICRCNFGYELADDGVTCKTEHANKNFFLVTDKLSSEIYQVNKSGDKVWATFAQNGARPQRVTFNPVTREVIWFDVAARAIKASSLDGASVRVLRAVHGSGTIETHSVNSLYVDTSTNNLYYVESRDNDNVSWIRVTSISKGVTKTLYTSSQDPPRFLAISPQTGRLVYGIRSGNVVLADMTLENSRNFRTNVTGISGLTFARSGATVVWSDSVRDEIVEFDLATSASTTRASNANNLPHSLVASGSDLYFLTSSGRTIKVLSAANKEEKVAEFTEFGELTSLYFQGETTAQEATACREKNGRCSTLCIPTPSGGRQCACEDNVEIEEDKRTCKNIERCSNAILYGSLSATCDRYPDETCDFTCAEGHKKNPAGSSLIFCQSNGQWNVSTDSLCLITCPRTLDVGQVSSDCWLTAGAKCSVVCNDGYEFQGDLIECGEDGRWKQPADQVCRRASKGEPFPVYAIIIVSVGAVILVVVAVGCFLYNRLRRFGGRDTVRNNGFDNTPVIFVTDTGVVNGIAAKQINDDNLSAEYDELEPAAEEVRYQSFSKISPRLGGHRQRASCQPPPVQGFSNSGFNEQGLYPGDRIYRGLHEEEDDAGADPLLQSFYITPTPPVGANDAQRVNNPAYTTPSLLRVIDLESRPASRPHSDYLEPAPDYLQIV